MRPARVAFALVVVLAGAGAAAAQSRSGELRGVWLTASRDRDWPALMRALKENGFNAAFVNFSADHMASYPSKVLPVLGGRDELAEAARAARQHGIELHVWRTQWALGAVGPEVARPLEQAGRLQRDAEGGLARDDPAVAADWLCPSHRDNRKLELEAVLEVVRSYDIAGVQLGAMRFPSGDYCFCDHCRAQFEREARVTVSNWPSDVQEGGPLFKRWRAWRRELLTGLVREISEECHRIKPDIKMSLGAWPDLRAAYDGIAQEWVDWAKEGALDFVCPMDYTADLAELGRMLRAQVQRVGGAAPVYAGLGAFLMPSSPALAAQIEASREQGADGFVLFSLDERTSTWLADLRMSATAGEPGPAPHWAPPAQFTFSGPAASPPAAGSSVIAGERLEAAIVLGLAPPDLESENAAAPPGLLERAAGTPRSPVTSYEPRPLPSPFTGERAARISGRVVVETPLGLPLAVLGAFDGGPGVKRVFRLVPPEGRFRIAVYGQQREGDGPERAFVARGPLLEGIARERLLSEQGAVTDELGTLLAARCAAIPPERLRGLKATIQLRATGPGGGEWWVRVNEGACETGQGEVPSPDILAIASRDDFLALLQGRADPMALWESGRVSVTGSLTLVTRLALALGYPVG